MNSYHSVAPVHGRGGFTLTEIVLALAIIATVFVAVLGLLPAGLDASRQAADSTIVANILENVHQQLQNQPLKSGVLPISPIYYDDQGSFLSPIPLDTPEAEKDRIARRFYRADVEVREWAKQPENTSNLKTVNVALSWPVEPTKGEALGKDNPKTVITYAATTHTGPDWELIYPSGRPDLKYEPKIEF